MRKTLTSARNPRVLAARKLRRRAGRVEAGACLVEGRIGVLEALRSGARVQEVFVSDDLSSIDEISDLAAEHGVEIHVSGRTVVAALSETTTPQGVVAVVATPLAQLGDLIPAARLLVLLDQVRDPGNAGTLVRSAVAAAADGVIFLSGSVDPWNPKALRASAGAAFRVPIVMDVPIEEALEGIRSAGFHIVAADAHSREKLDPTHVDGPLALVLGNEAWGLAAEHRDLVDQTIGIRMPGPVESLNVAVAGSILLFEIIRQRGAAAPGLSSSS